MTAPVQLVPEPDSSQLDTTPDTSASYAADKAKILARLRRMEGQVRGVQRMVEEDKYCVDILTQISSVIAAARAFLGCFSSGPGSAPVAERRKSATR